MESNRDGEHHKRKKAVHAVQKTTEGKHGTSGKENNSLFIYRQNKKPPFPGDFLEATIGIEPMHGGFAVPSVNQLRHVAGLRVE